MKADYFRQDHDPVMSRSFAYLHLLQERNAYAQTSMRCYIEHVLRLEAHVDGSAPDY